MVQAGGCRFSSCLNHDCIFKFHLRLSFTWGIFIIHKNLFLRLRRSWERLCLLAYITTHLFFHSIHFCLGMLHESLNLQMTTLIYVTTVISLLLLCHCVTRGFPILLPWLSVETPALPQMSREEPWCFYQVVPLLWLSNFGKEVLRKNYVKHFSVHLA